MIAGTKISRRHARIPRGPRGAQIIDESATGTYGNGQRVDGACVLRPGDVLRMGAVELRYEAVSPPPEPRPDAGRGAVPNAQEPEPLATLEVIGGSLAGTTYRVLRPVCSVGRGEANDVRVQDDRAALGYQIKDSSTNGVYVNAQRVVGERWLSVGDAVGVGPAQFRFEADATTYEPDVSAIDTGNLPPLAAAPSLAPDESMPPPNETVRLSRRAEPTTTEAPLLATWFSPTRASRARTRSWSDAPTSGYVVDGDSKNGTYVDGNRISGEGKLPPACEIRFGGVKALFRALAVGQHEDPSTRGVVGIMDAEVAKKPKR